MIDPLDEAFESRLLFNIIDICLNCQPARRYLRHLNDSAQEEFVNQSLLVVYFKVDLLELLGDLLVHSNLLKEK